MKKWEVRKTNAGHFDIYAEGQPASHGKVARVPYSTNEACTEKNARLIAAAPELLESAKRFMSSHNEPDEATALAKLALAVMKAEVHPSLLRGEGEVL